MVKRLIAVAVLLACVSSAMPAQAGTLVVEDQAGDANGLATWEELLHVGPLKDAPYAPGTGPVSYAPGDLRKVWMSTYYRTETIGSDGKRYVPIGINLHIETEAPFDPEGPTMLYSFEMRTPEGCNSDFLLERAGGHFLSPGTNDLVWSLDPKCTPDPNDENDPNVINGIFRSSAWTASETNSGWSIFISFASLEPWQLDILGPGKTVPKFGARTQTQLLIYPYLDQTRMTGTFRIGQDVPKDIPCTRC